MPGWTMQLAVLLTFLFAPVELGAHKTESLSSSEAFSEAIAGQSTPPLLRALAKGLLDHAHNQLVHFPIALGITAVLFVFLGVRFPELERPAEILVWLAAMSAAFAAATGLAQEEVPDASSRHGWMDVHQVLGLLSTGSLFLWGFFFRFRPFRFLARPWGVVVLILLSLTGAVGGVIAHG